MLRVENGSTQNVKIKTNANKKKYFSPAFQVEKADIFGLRKTIIFQKGYYVSTNQPPSKYDIIYSHVLLFY
jgi:hypothetical protein